MVAYLPLRAADDRPKGVPVYCPAIAAEDRPRTNALGEPTHQPTLVALGTARLAGKEEKNIDEQKVEIEVEKVLFGSAPGPTVRCLSGWAYRPDEKPKRLILALTPRLDSKDFPFEVRYTLPPEEEKAVAALSAARMDYNTLSSEAIFVGREVQVSGEKGRIIEVLRVFHGPDSLKGQKVCVDLLEHPLRTGFNETTDHLPATGEHLYFVAAVDPEYRKRPFRSITNPDGPVYLVRYRLPADQEKHVVEALKRRDQYPLVEIEDLGKKVTSREVLFRGSVVEAIELLGSESEGAVALGGRFLIHRKKEAHLPVLADIEADLLRAQRKGGFRRLSNLISLLPRLSSEAKDEDVRELVEKWLAHLAKKPPEPPALKPEPWETYFRDEEDHTDVNHSLAWLLQRLNEETVVKQYGKRLLALRDEVPAGWKQEVQLGLDVAKVEDHLELEAAWARMKDVRPVRSRTGMRHPGGKGEGVVAFTPDGNYLATLGGGELRFWQTKDWTLAAPAIPLEASISRLVFSPDGKYLYVAGGGPWSQRHSRYDWKARRLDRAYTGHTTGLADLLLSADGKTMATSSYFEDTIHVWDTQTGKIRKTFKTPRGADQIALSPDGDTLLRKVALGSADEEHPKTGWVVEALGPRALKVPKGVLDDNPGLVAFSADGKYCLTVGGTDGYGGAQTQRAVRLFDVPGGFREVAKTAVRSLPPRRATFYTEQRIVLLEGVWTDGDMHALLLPDLKPMPGFEQAQQKCSKTKFACFSPDGKLLAVGVLFRPTPQLFRTDTYEEVIPYEGHGENISEVFFQAGGKIVRTLGRDGTVCTWDARTMKMLKRQSLPAGWSQEGSRQPDGRYLIGWTGPGGKESLQVFDVEADKVTASVKVSVEAFGNPHLFWLNDHEVYTVAGGELCHFDAATGKVLARRKLTIRPERSASLTEDGKDIFIVAGGIPKYPRVEVRRVSVQTGKETLVGEFNLRTFSGNDAGLVPGGSFFYIGNPGFYLFDSRTLKPVASRAFRGTDSLSLAFADEGTRFAVVTGGQIHLDRNLRQWDPQTQSVVRVHDTQTSRTLGAFPASTRWVSVKLSPDGKQLAVANDDGTFELWDLSALNGP
jgi:WD40 repeat protein